MGTSTPNSKKCKFLVAQAAKVDSLTHNPGLRHPQSHQKSGGKEKNHLFEKKKWGYKKLGMNLRKNRLKQGGYLKRQKPNLENRP